ADVDFHHGQHVDAIVAKFAARGIPIGLLDVHVSGPAELEPDQPGTFDSQRSGGLKPFTYVWEQNDVCSCVLSPACGAWRPLPGAGPRIQASSPSDFVIRVTVTDSLGIARTDQWPVSGRYTCNVGVGDPRSTDAPRLVVAPNPARTLAGISF